MTPLKLVEKKNLWFSLSLSVIAVGLGLMSFRALQKTPVLNFGIDFTGGSTLMLTIESLTQQHQSRTQEQSSRDINVAFISDIRQLLVRANQERTAIQITKDLEVIIKTPLLVQEERQHILTLFKEKWGQLNLLEIDAIGPSIGHELRQKSIIIILLVSFVLLGYISWRFEFAFGISALIALLHDALITLSLAAIFSLEINTAFIAAILTILGYSINDTIVIFDRVRENMAQADKKESFASIANTAIYQTFTRTVSTSVTTLCVILSLIIFGGITIKAFCLVLLIGILAGTYSSIFIACPALLLFTKK